MFLFLPGTGEQAWNTGVCSSRVPLHIITTHLLFFSSSVTLSCYSLLFQRVIYVYVYVFPIYISYLILIRVTQTNHTYPASTRNDFGYWYSALFNVQNFVFWNKCCLTCYKFALRDSLLPLGGWGPDDPQFQVTLSVIEGWWLYKGFPKHKATHFHAEKFIVTSIYT